MDLAVFSFNDYISDKLNTNSHKIASSLLVALENIKIDFQKIDPLIFTAALRISLCELLSAYATTNNITSDRFFRIVIDEYINQAVASVDVTVEKFRSQFDTILSSIYDPLNKWVFDYILTKNDVVDKIENFDRYYRANVYDMPRREGLLAEFMRRLACHFNIEERIGHDFFKLLLISKKVNCESENYQKIKKTLINGHSYASSSLITEKDLSDKIRKCSKCDNVVIKDGQFIENYEYIQNNLDFLIDNNGLFKNPEQALGVYDRMQNGTKFDKELSDFYLCSSAFELVNIAAKQKNRDGRK